MAGENTNTSHGLKAFIIILQFKINSFVAITNVKALIATGYFCIGTVQAASATRPVGRLSEIYKMSIRVTTVEVCDATTADSSNAAG